MLSDEAKTKEQLISELAMLRQLVTEFEALETKRKQVEEELKKSEERFRIASQIASDVVYERDLQTGIATFYGDIDTHLGYDSGGYPRTGEGWREHVHPEDLAWIESKTIDQLEPDVPYSIEYRMRKKDGTYMTWFDQIMVIRDEKTGKPIKFIGAATDITERKQVEQQLKESESFLNNIIEQSPFSTWISDDKGTNIRQNQACRELFGIEKDEEVIGKYNFHKDEEIRKQGLMPLIEEVYSKGKTVNFVIDYNFQKVKHVKVPGATHKIIDATIFPIKDADGKVTNAVFQHKDITERKLAEEELKESEENLRAYLESAPDGVYLNDLKGTFLYGNKRAEEIIGYGREKLIGSSFLELGLLPEGYLEKAGKLLELNAMGKPTGPDEFELVSRDGSRIWVEINTATIREKGEDIVIGFVRDITERKQAEEREKELQQQLYLSSRLAAVGELAAGVAHEISNPLTGILGFSERLMRKSTDEEITRDLEIIHNEAQRVAKVVGNLLTFARRREPKKEYLDINDILQRALELRAYALETSNIEVVTSLAPGLPRTMADFHQIQEVFLNIILNAEQAMSEASAGGKLSIKTQPTGDYIRISFADDGPGIPAEHLDKVFDPFFTTRGEKGGTGLGLSLCHGIVAEHAGKIYAKSKPGKGATFFVELPLCPIGASFGHKY